MAHAETTIVHDAMKRASSLNARLFKNVRGVFYPLSIKKLIAAAFRKSGVAGIIGVFNTTPQIHAGLSAPGSGDLIGWYPLTITQAMVGKRVAVFWSAEGKRETGRAQEDQLNFMEQVQKNGGISGIFRSANDLEKMLKSYLHNLEI